MILLLLITLGVLIVLVLWLLPRANRTSDDAARWLADLAAHRLPADRQEWGRAMTSELAHVPSGRRRWRFAVGVLRVALVPRRSVVLTGVAGLAISAAATLVARAWVYPLAVFVAVVCVLLSGYATRLVARRSRPRTGWVGTIALLASVTAVMATAIDTAIRHPAAAADPTHVFSILFAVILAGYTVFALTPPAGLAADSVAVRWGVAAGLGCGSLWTALALAQPPDIEGSGAALWPVLLTMVVAVGVGAVRDSLRAGGYVGVWAGLVGGALYFVVNLVPLLALHTFTLTAPYDIAKFPHSGFPDVASYILSDDLGGLVIGLVWLPLMMTALALVGGFVGVFLRALVRTAS